MIFKPLYKSDLNQNNGNVYRRILINNQLILMKDSLC